MSFEMIAPGWMGTQNEQGRKLAGSTAWCFGCLELCQREHYLWDMFDSAACCVVLFPSVALLLLSSVLLPDEGSQLH